MKTAIYEEGLAPAEPGNVPDEAVEMMNFTENRAKHCRAVALYMQEHAEKLGLNPNEAFLCGYLHDSGYALGDDLSHAQKGGVLLFKQGYKYWKEIALHGTVDGLCCSMGVLLNIADMMVDSRGNPCTFEDRLKDITKRYGLDSVQYHNASNVILKLVKTREYKILGVDNESH